MAVVVEQGPTRIAVVTHDGYAATVGTLAVCLRQLWSSPRLEPGLRSVSELVAPRAALRWLVQRGLVSVLRGDRSR